jgi:hypothetical protein
LSANSSPATEKIVWGLSLKIFQNDTIDIEDSVGVQNRQAGCYRRMPFLAPIKDGIRQGAEQLVTRQQRTGGR